MISKKVTKIDLHQWLKTLGDSFGTSNLIDFVGSRDDRDKKFHDEAAEFYRTSMKQIIRERDQNEI